MASLFTRLKLNFKLQLAQIIEKVGILELPLHYVQGSQSLPPPLSADEERYLIERLDEGDKSVRNLLIEHNLRLVVYIAKKFDNSHVPIEDLVSIGTIGLIKAVKTFDPSRKVKLATYASKCIENEILMFLRRNNKTKSEISLEEPLNVDWDGNELVLSDVIPGVEKDSIYKQLESKVDKAMLREAMKKLSERGQRIVELRFGLNDGFERTQKEVADELGISQSYISRLEKRILKKLRKEMSKM